ncbi:hypothetical protein HS088_TW02G01114 [Tripterygium wilfordii]|uniref:Nematode resistance protein-like HSPRO1 N-terminal domain-containing protein n=1 Tax=Tripterygium wilfordii TaxID=458696 RepID=A0A7J7E0A7_TRIWF|nr:hypothetical protein HS088_TW02G01114 [Tripterygium wilfordii]
MVLLDQRPYVNQWEWKRRLQSFVESQVELIEILCVKEEENGETLGNAPIADELFHRPCSPAWLKQVLDAGNSNGNTTGVGDGDNVGGNPKSQVPAFAVSTILVDMAG